MTNFLTFKSKVQQQLTLMAGTGLFVVDVEKDVLWNAYLDSFPEGTNEIFRKCRQYDCSCCKQFIRTVGALVTIVDNNLVSIWDIDDAPAEFGVVTKALSKIVHEQSIQYPFVHYDQHIGTDSNIELLEDGGTHKWEHFYSRLPRGYVVEKTDIPSQRGDRVEDRNVFQRSMEELTVESAEIVLELIAQNSIYRGEEHKALVELFIEYKTRYSRMNDLNNFCWEAAATLKHGGRFRNTVIGTLLTDLSDGVDLTLAVKAFEKKVAPENYKRPTALITQSMIKKAQEKVEDLGLTTALPRRYATIYDITINNVIYADRTEKSFEDVFDELSGDIAVDVKSFTRAEQVPVAKFFSDVVPEAERIELFLENGHAANLMSVVAPVSLDASPILKWDNNFSWTYQGEVTDSIKERVKRAGGDVTGVLRCSLSWSNGDDLDIHVVEPGGNEIYWDNARSSTAGNLDVDMNAGGRTNEIDPVENITWPKQRTMQEGQYEVDVHNYNKRSKSNVGFEAEIEFNGNVYNFSHPEDLPGQKRVAVAKFTFNTDSPELLDMQSDLNHAAKVKEVWGVNTNNFHRVRVIMNSPNHWDGQTNGNKHWFFILEDCINPEQSRGLFNEFLRGDLTEHRKVFEMLGSKMKVEKSDNQLSGLGFSSTQRNSVFCKVKGRSERTIEVIF